MNCHSILAIEAKLCRAKYSRSVQLDCRNIRQGGSEALLSGDLKRPFLEAGHHLHCLDTVTGMQYYYSSIPNDGFLLLLVLLRDRVSVNQDGSPQSSSQIIEFMNHFFDLMLIIPSEP
jgi:hypothetical protein